MDGLQVRLFVAHAGSRLSSSAVTMNFTLPVRHPAGVSEYLPAVSVDLHAVLQRFKALGRERLGENFGAAPAN
jgi:hypothetical protein